MNPLKDDDQFLPLLMNLKWKTHQCHLFHAHDLVVKGFAHLSQQLILSISQPTPKHVPAILKCKQYSFSHSILVLLFMFSKMQSIDIKILPSLGPSVFLAISDAEGIDLVPEDSEINELLDSFCLFMFTFNSLFDWTSHINLHSIGRNYWL